MLAGVLCGVGSGFGAPAVLILCGAGGYAEWGLHLRNWEQEGGKRVPSTGPYQIAVSKLRKLNESVAQAERVPRAV